MMAARDQDGSGSSELCANDRLQRRAISRRMAMQIGLGAAAALATNGSASLLAEESKPPSLAKIDIHTHVGKVWNHSRELSADALLKWMDSSGIEKAVVLPLVSPESSSFLLTTDFVLEQTNPHRDRLIPFCCIDPRTSYSGERHGLRDMIRKYVDQGCKGFGEHKPGVPIDDKRSMEIYAVCGELKLPVLFHLDGQRNTDEPGLPGLARVLKAFPETILIGHGPGWWASIAGDTTKAQLGGYPRGPVAAGGTIDRLMDAYPNLHGDLSAGSGAGAIARDPKFGRDFLIRRADRLMFGSDYLEPGQDVPQLKLVEKIDVSVETKGKVLRGNAMRLLGL